MGLSACPKVAPVALTTAGAGSIAVEQGGVGVVNPATTLNFIGATVVDAGGGVADITIAAGGSLQSAYNGGNTITTAADRPVQLTGDASLTSPLLQVDNDADDNAALQLRAGAGPEILFPTTISGGVGRIQAQDAVGASGVAGVGVDLVTGDGDGAAAGGALSLSTGAGGNTGSGGNFFVTLGDAGAGGGNGGIFSLTAGSGPGNGGVVLLTAGDSTDPGGTGGEARLTGGVSGSGAGFSRVRTQGASGVNGGSIQLSTGAGDPAGGLGGIFEVLAGDSTGANTGGPISGTAGDGGATSGAGGSVTWNTGDAGGGNADGGVYLNTTGDGAGSGDGGPWLATLGDGGATGDGGSHTLQGGAGGATSGAGGGQSLLGGAGGPGGVGGGQFFQGGAGGAGAAGGGWLWLGGAGNGVGPGGSLAAVAGTGGNGGVGGGISLAAGPGTNAAGGFLDFTPGGYVATGSVGAARLLPAGTAAGETGELQFLELAANGTNFTGLKSSDARGSSITYVLPATDPTAAQVLQAAAPVGGVSDLSWVNVSGTPSVATLTSVANATVLPVSSGQLQTFELELDEDTTLALPSGSPAEGQVLEIIVKQDGTGGWDLTLAGGYTANLGTLDSVDPAANSYSAIYLTARDFGSGIEWYYSITNGDPVPGVDTFNPTATQTTNATETTAYSLTTSGVSRMYRLSFTVTAVEALGANARTFVVHATGIIDSGGTLTVPADQVDILSSPDTNNGWTVDVDASGADIRIRVTGEAATTIDWQPRGEYEVLAA